jgi:hypothetical protein
MLLPAIALTLSSDDRQRALNAAAQAANPSRGREVFLQTLAITAFQQLWSWLDLGPDCPAIDGLPGEVGRIGLPQGGSIAFLPLLQETLDDQSTDQQAKLRIDWPIDWPDDVVAFVPVAVNRSLDRAWLWGWVSVGDLSLPPSVTHALLSDVLQQWEALEPYLWRVQAALAWIAEAADPVAQQVRQAIAPDERMALVASLDRQYREGDPMSGLMFGLSSFSFDDEEESLERDISEESLESDITEDSLPEDVWLSDLLLPDSLQDDLPQDDSPLTYGSPADRPTAKVRDAANPYRAKTDYSKTSNPPDRAWQDLKAPLLERLLPIWERQGDHVDTDADAHFSDDLEDLFWDLQIDRLDLDADAQFDDALDDRDDNLQGDEGVEGNDG